jgi:phosphoribosyl 1,2-cyclic phosphodiesterase
VQKVNIKIIASSSAGNCYQVDNILIEAGMPIKAIKKALNYRLSNMSGCLVSHSHGDHAKAAGDILKAGVDLYCSKETAEERGLSGHRLHIIEPLKQFELGGWKIKPFPLKHDVTNFGFLLSRDGYKIMFAVDTNYIPYKFTGLTHVLLGVNYDSDILRGKAYREELNPAVAQRSLTNHMSISTALDFFKKLDKSALRSVFLLHLSDANSDEKAFKLAVQKIVGIPVMIGG